MQSPERQIHHYFVCKLGNILIK